MKQSLANFFRTRKVKEKKKSSFKIFQASNIATNFKEVKEIIINVSFASCSVEEKSKNFRDQFL